MVNNFVMINNLVLLYEVQRKKSSINLRVFNFIAEEINPIFTNCVIKKYQCFKQVYIILKRHV